MREESRNQIVKFLPIDEEGLDMLLHDAMIKAVRSGTILLFAGDVADSLFFVVKGCLRAYFIKENGIEKTAQFFLEGQMVASFESAMTGTPSKLYIDAIEDSEVGFIRMEKLKLLASKSKSIMERFNRFLVSRLIAYMNHHASFILDNPEERYKKLLKENPDLVSRLPLQHVASYLGITPVSLSRIRARLKKQKQINNC